MGWFLSIMREVIVMNVYQALSLMITFGILVATIISACK